MKQPGFREWKALAKKAYMEGRMKDAEYYKKKAYECKNHANTKAGVNPQL